MAKEKTVRYLVIIAKGKRNYSSYAPDVPGCIAVGDTFEECKMSMQEALEFHLEGDESLPVPHASPNDPEIVNNPNLTPIYIDITIPHRAA